MASRQRSFFDQNPQKSHRWPNRKPLYPSHPSLPPPKPPVALPPIAASSRSRSKLNAFCYVPTDRDTGNTHASMHCIATFDKENESPRRGTISKKSSQENARETAGAREYPQTPVARVPFADLLANEQEPVERPPQCTPADNVTWRHSPHSSDTESDATPRGKKRAHSSSPASCGRVNSASAYFEGLNRPSLGLQNLHNSSSTAQMDPAYDIEHRYFAMLSTPSRPPATAAAELMHSSSPQTPDVRTDSAKLRRTMSCGIAYPNSRAKRRKLSMDATVSVQKSPVDKPAKHRRTGHCSRVSILLEKIESARQPEAEHSKAVSGVSSSTPLPAIERSMQPQSASEPLGRSKDLDAGSRPIVGTRRTSKASLDEPKSFESASSHYGGEDIDMELVDAAVPTWLDQKDTPAIEQPQSPVPTTQPFSNSQDIAPPVAEQKKISVDDLEAAGRLADDFGEDEDMDDLFAADFEILASKYDQDATRKTANDADPQETRQLQSQPQVGAKRELAGEAVATTGRSIDYAEVSSDEEFGGNDFDDIAEECGNLTQAFESRTPNRSKPSVIHRFVVKAVIDSQYETKSGRKAPEKLLHVQEFKTDTIKLVSLRESWWDTACPLEASVHVIGDFDQNGLCVVDNTRNLLIVHPDYLLSATVVADAFKCTRRAVLQDRVKATSEVNESQIYGHILHELFQEALKANRWDQGWFESTIWSVASRYLESLFELNIRLELAAQHLLGKIPELQSWAQLFISAKQKPGAFIKGPNESLTPTVVTKLLDVEEHVWSPRYGIKGNIDATIQVAVEEDKNQRNLVVPFEFKTGRKREKESNISHNSQTALYTLLLSDRYDVQIAFGILYYLETSEMSQITGLRHEIAGMIQRRNEIASYVKDRQQLPRMLRSQHTCSHCYAQTSCFVYHKLSEDGDGMTSGLGQKFTEAMEHLKPCHADFFKRWDTLLTKEEADVVKFRKELWTMTSAEREKVGRCFGNIVIKPGSANENMTVSKINRFEYIFSKPGAAVAFSFADSQINLGEPIVISDEAGHYALANGYVTKIRKHEISVAVDRRLHNARAKDKDFDSQNNQSFTGIMEVTNQDGVQSSLKPEEPEEPVKYRLDKDEFSNGMATVRNNLIRVMEKDLFGAQFIRRLVIEDVAPTFLPPPSTLKTHFEHKNDELNVDQKNAISKVMEAQEYALVLGMPGTGKTTTIAHIIRALTASGKSVLLTSYTHTAVDNILLKIASSNLSILRIGAEAKIHPSVKSFVNLASSPKPTFEAVEASYRSQVVATTCLGINHPIFNQRTFDYCIVDEASQITLPVCLGPIRMAHRFVLVGDHYQLPPLVQNKEAQAGGLDVSLFKLLSDRHPESVVSLEHQYRMCADIMSLSNELIYSGRLKCGTDAVAQRELHIPDLAALAQLHHTPLTLAPSQTTVCPGPVQGSCWIREILDPRRRVVFVNTDSLGEVAREVAHGSRVTNPVEVSLATQVVRALMATGIDSSEVGVITLYRSQLGLLKQSMRASAAGVEMHTADKFQGRDKEVVVLSLVRSNENGNVGELLLDWRRVNVALTRARTKLVIVGSFGTIEKGSDLLRQFCGLVEGRAWRFDLKPKALDEHYFEEMGTQLGLAQTVEVVKKESQKSPNKSQGSQGKIRVPGKSGRMDPARLLKTRPVLRDVLNEVMA